MDSERISFAGWMQNIDWPKTGIFALGIGVVGFLIYKAFNDDEDPRDPLAPIV